MLDPDAGVQQALRHLFAVFGRTGSARAVVAAFAADKLLFPVRISSRPRKGELAWMPLTHWRVLRTLHNPRYAGVFVYGRRRGTISANGKSSLQPLPRGQWTALIPGAHPGYITWEAYEANQQILAGNAAARGADRAAGPAREGTALLQGLAICGRCGRADDSARSSSPSAPFPSPAAAPVSVHPVAQGALVNTKVLSDLRDRAAGLPDQPDRALLEVPIELPACLCHRPVLPLRRCVHGTRGSPKVAGRGRV